MEEEKYLQDLINDTYSLEGIKDPKEQEKFKKQFLEMLCVVDDRGNTIGKAPRGLCHRLGLRHKTVYVLVVSKDGRMLLQQRGGGIDALFGRLDVAVGGHLKAGEDDPKLSACREMREELGITAEKDRLYLVVEHNRDAPPVITKPFERNRERRYLFKYVLTDEEMSELDQLFSKRESRGEVVSIAWYTVGQVLDVIDRGQVADGLLTSFTHYLGERPFRQ